MKKIPLNQNKVVILDNEDFDKLSKYNWHNNGYVYRYIKQDNKQIRIFMHREILNADFSQEIDHINNNTLDNRRINLRLCNHSNNSKNLKIYKNNTSGYKGVYWNKRNQKWATQINFNNYRLFLGYFDDKIDAAKAYNEAALEYHREFAKLNIL